MKKSKVLSTLAASTVLLSGCVHTTDVHIADLDAIQHHTRCDCNRTLTPEEYKIHQEHIKLRQLVLDEYYRTGCNFKKALKKLDKLQEQK